MALARGRLSFLSAGGRKPARPPLALSADEAVALWRCKKAVLIDLSDWERVDARGWIEGSMRCPPQEFESLIDPSSALHRRLFEPGKTFIFYGGRKAAPSEAARRARAMGHVDAAALRGGKRAWARAGGRVAGHPQSALPALKASIGLATKYIVAAAKARLARLRTS